MFQKFNIAPSITLENINVPCHLFYAKYLNHLAIGNDENLNPKFSMPCIIVSIDASSPTSIKNKKKHIRKFMAMLELLIFFLVGFCSNG
jgi:hypothetical protein